jgi:acetyl-CoA acetyltransferase
VGTSCFGRQEDFVELRLVGEDGNEVGVDAPGELLVRSSGNDPRRYFFSGYLKDEEATREAWSGGWFHTGDLVRRDPEGNFFFVDRKKNVIRRSGENISAVEVESVLNQHPAVKTSAVAATPDEVRGDEVLACIVPREATDALANKRQIAASIVDHALSRLAYYKAPGYVAFRRRRCRSRLSQKIQRGQLRDLARTHCPGQPHCVDTRALKKRQPRHDATDFPTTTSRWRCPSRCPTCATRRRARTGSSARPCEALLHASGHRQGADRRSVPSAVSRSRPDTAVGVTQHLGLSPRWLDHVPTGGASGVMCLRRAARAVQAGDADIVACIGADTNHVDSFRLMLGGFSAFARDASYPYGSGGPNSIFAFITAQLHAAPTARAAKTSAASAVDAARQRARSNPNALFKKPLTLDEYMAARPISDPLHLFDCVMPCAGADAFLVMTRSASTRAGPRARRGARRHRAPQRVCRRSGHGAAAAGCMDRDELYAQAGVHPTDVDFIQTYDDYPVIVMLQFEDLGFCDKGERLGLRAVAHASRFDGDFPNNTSGGQLSVGQAGARAASWA